MLKKIQDRLARRLRPEFLTYDAAGGMNELKEALADYLRTARGVRCSPEQILITEGIHRALDLVTRTLCNPGDHARIESRVTGESKIFFASMPLIFLLFRLMNKAWSRRMQVKHRQNLFL